MPTFAAADGTEIAYHLLGAGAPTICLPGGPMQDSAYLGDLGGLADGRQLVMVDFRGTGASGMPTDPATFRCDGLVEDVEALREHLGLDRVSLLGHSAGVNVAVQYAARYPKRIGRLLLITPSTMAVGIETTPEVRDAVVQLRVDEPWFAAAAAGWANIAAGTATETTVRSARRSRTAAGTRPPRRCMRRRKCGAMTKRQRCSVRTARSTRRRLAPDLPRSTRRYWSSRARSTGPRVRPLRPRSPRCSRIRLLSCSRVLALSLAR